MNAGDVTQLLQTQLNAAREGSAAAAALTAMLIHKYPKAAGQLGVASQYDWLLSQVQQSKDPELIVCVGEELFSGRKLALNPARAMKFFSRADDLSSFMGSFVLGRLALTLDKKSEALSYFRRAREAGHMPSAVLENHVMSGRIPILGWFIKRIRGLGVMAETWRAVHSDQKHLRMWRFKDVFPDDGGAIAEQVGADRGQPIPPCEALNDGASES